MVILSRIDRQVNELIKILEKQKWTSIEFLTVGYVTLNITLYKPKYKYITKGNYIQIYVLMNRNKFMKYSYITTNILNLKYINNYVSNLSYMLVIKQDLSL